MVSRKLIFAVMAFSIFSSNAAAQEFKVAAILGLTGPAQVWGKYARMGAELAVTEQNANGGVAGRKVLFTVEDSRSTSAGAVSAFQKTIAVDKPDAVLGDVWSQLFEPLIPMAAASKVVVISPTVVASTVTSGPYAFTMGQKPDTAANAVGRFFDAHPQIKTVAIFCWDNPWGAAYLALWKKEANKRHIKIVREVCVNDFAYDFRTDVSKVVSLKPDAVIIAHLAERILKLFAEQKMRPLVLSTSNIREVLRDGTLEKQLAEGVYLTDWTPKKEFADKFQARFHEPPMLEAHNSYEALRAIFRAHESGSSSLKEGFGAVHYEGVAGPVDFRGTGAGNNARASLLRIHDGAVEAVGKSATD